MGDVNEIGKVKASTARALPRAKKKPVPQKARLISKPSSNNYFTGLVGCSSKPKISPAAKPSAAPVGPIGTIKALFEVAPSRAPSIRENFKKNIKLGDKYFIKNIGTDVVPIHVVESLTQGNQIVSEGFGYAMTRVVNQAMRYAKEGLRGKSLEMQKTYNGLMRGVLLTLNKNGLPSWRSYTYEDDFNPKNNSVYRKRLKTFPDKYGKLKESGIEFRSKYATYSASDADIYIARASIKAEALVEKGFWKKHEKFSLPASLVTKRRHNRGWAVRDLPSKVGYFEFSELMVEGIKNFDVEKKGNRLVLKVSDMWGGGDIKYEDGDIKGTVTANDSYSIFSALAELSQAFPSDRKFFLRLRRDSFDRLEAVYRFGQKRFKILKKAGLVVRNGRVTLEREERQLFINLVAKLSPSELSKDTDLPSKKRKVAKDGLIFDAGYIMLEDKADVYQVRQDGSWDINALVYKKAMAKIKKYGLHKFFPDQVEVEVKPNGWTYNVRFEIGANNLSFTENFDGIRVYAELGKDLLYRDDASLDKKYNKYKISKRQFKLLDEIMKDSRKTPEVVRAGRYNNAAAISCYFMALAGLARYDSSYNARFTKFQEKLNSLLVEGTKKRAKALDIFNRKENGNIPDYYNAMLALKNLSEFFARDSVIYGKGHKLIASYKKLARPSELPQVSTWHEDFDYALKALSLDVQSLKRLSGNLTKEQAEKIQYGRAMAERKLKTALKEKNPKDMKTMYSLLDALIEYGAYHGAFAQSFETLRDVKEPKTSGINEKLFNNALSTMIDIMGLFRKNTGQRSDLLKWLVDRQDPSSNKSKYMKLSLLDEYIGQRRINMAKQMIATLNPPEASWRDRLNVDQGRWGRAVLPRQDMASRLLANYIQVLGLDYNIGKFVPGVKGKFVERRYHYGKARAALEMVIGGKAGVFLSLKQKVSPITHRENRWLPLSGKLAPKEVDRINQLNNILPEALHPRLIYSYGRVLQQMAYDQKDSIANRLFYSEDWQIAWHDDKKKTVGEMSQIIENTDRAISFYKEALRRELLPNKGLRDSKFLTKVVNAILDANNFKLTILRTKEVEAKKAADAPIMVGKNKDPLADAEYRLVAGKKLATILEIEIIARSAKNAFKGILKDTFAIKEPKNVIAKAFVSIVSTQEMKSPDPRNINYINWLRKFIGSLSNAGISTGKKEYFDKAFGQVASIVNEYVGNSKLKALFVVESAVKMAGSLFSFWQIQRVKSGNKNKRLSDDKKRDIKTIFDALLAAKDGKVVTIPPGAPKEIVPILKYIKGNKKTIAQVFLDDPTQEAKIRTTYANLIWWGEDWEDSVSAVIKRTAISQYKRALRIDPFDPATLFGIAEVSALQKNIPDAVRYFVRGVRAMSGASVEQYSRRKIPDLIEAINNQVKKIVEGGNKEKLSTNLRASIRKANDYLSKLQGKEVEQNHIDYLTELFRSF